MVFTHGPSAHLPCLATRAGVGRITLSSGIVRFVQGGVVKTFRCATLVQRSLDLFRAAYQAELQQDLTRRLSNDMVRFTQHFTFPVCFGSDDVRGFLFSFTLALSLFQPSAPSQCLPSKSIHNPSSLTTWDEPWQKEIIEDSDTFVRVKVTLATPERVEFNVL